MSRLLYAGLALSLTVTFQSASAQPLIQAVSTDELRHGKTLVIDGDLFGQKNTVSPLRYDDFEYGVDGESIDGDVNGMSSYWETRADFQPVSKPDMSISTVQAHGGTRSTRSILTFSDPWNLARNDKAWKNEVGFASTGKAYVNYWIYWDWGTASDHPTKMDNFQIKTLYLGDYDDGAGDMFPGMYMIGWQHQDYANETGYNWNYITVHNANSVPILKAPDFNSGHNAISRTPGWYNVAMQVDMGTPGGSDGSLKVWVSSLENNGYSYGQADNITIIGSGESFYDAVRLGWWRGDTSYGETAIYYDNIYLDNSFARVELGNAASYADCTRREIQIPAAWTEKQVSVEIRRGSFSPGENLYLFVVNESGEISEGFGPIAFTAAPESPRNLKRQK